MVIAIVIFVGFIASIGFGVLTGMFINAGMGDD